MTRCRAADLSRFPNAGDLAPCRLEQEGRCAAGCKRARFLLDQIQAQQMAAEATAGQEMG